jgi:hypothetical protein
MCPANCARNCHCKWLMLRSLFFFSSLSMALEYHFRAYSERHGTFDNLSRSRFTTKLLSCLIRASSQPIPSTHQIYSGLPGGSPSPRLHRVGCCKEAGPIMDCAMLTYHAAMRLRQGGPRSSWGWTSLQRCRQLSHMQHNTTQCNPNVREARPDKLLCCRASAAERDITGSVRMDRETWESRCVASSSHAVCGDNSDDPSMASQVFSAVEKPQPLSWVLLRSRPKPIPVRSPGIQLMLLSNGSAQYDLPGGGPLHQEVVYS